MGNSASNKDYVIGPDDVQQLLTTQKPLLINTLSMEEQACLIADTLHATEEESTINRCILEKAFSRLIVVYGKNYTDPQPHHTYKKLSSYGFTHVYVYGGGMFEWLLLQDIYGTKLFPTLGNEIDLLKYKPPTVIFR